MTTLQLSMSCVSLHRLRAEMLSEVAAKLIKAGSIAKEKSTKEMLSKLKTVAKEFNDAKAKEKTNQSTQLTQQYFDILKKRYTGLGGCLTAARYSGIKEKEIAAANIIPKYTNVSAVFALKCEAIGRMEKALTNLRTVNDADFETIGATDYLISIENTIEEYSTAVNSRVDVKVEKSKAVETSRDKLIKAMQNLFTAIKYAQDCIGGSETELVKSYNTIFAEIAASLKKIAAARGKNKKEDNN
ncbi:MAG: hypothetical protein IKS00_00530 [Bacteroidales bacterium]|nr:hypothetical protein [Bacteroidales bacterium]